MPRLLLLFIYCVMVDMNGGIFRIGADPVVVDGSITTWKSTAAFQTPYEVDAEECSENGGHGADDRPD